MLPEPCCYPLLGRQSLCLENAPASLAHAPPSIRLRYLVTAFLLQLLTLLPPPFCYPSTANSRELHSSSSPSGSRYLACACPEFYLGLVASLLSEPTPQQPPIRVASAGRSPYTACAQSAWRSPGAKRPIFKNGSLAGSPGDIAVAPTRPWFPHTLHCPHTSLPLRTALQLVQPQALTATAPPTFVCQSTSFAPCGASPVSR